MEQLLKYPVGLQTFAELRTKGYLYIDKTAYVYKMVHGDAKYVFLSRPRRFGKSLLVSTIKSFFEGRKDLFKGLAIDGLETEWIEYPVLHFSFASVKGDDEKSLYSFLELQLKNYEEFYGCKGKDLEYGARLSQLIQIAFAKTGHPVVVLIDEYDNPLLNVIHDDKRLEFFRNIMSDFYGSLKDNDPYLRFVFLTGITKFSQVSIFSTLNNIDNISMWDEYAAICGFTEEEVLTQMGPYLEDLAKAMDLSTQQTMAQLLYNYDGYHFCKAPVALLNPYSLVKCFYRKEFEPFWFETGTPSYLIKVLGKYHVEPSQIGEAEVEPVSFDAPTERMVDVVPLLYQSGYLTIKSYDPESKLYTLDIPNHEVRIGLMRALLPNYITTSTQAQTVLAKFVTQIGKGDLEEALKLLKAYFGTIPYTHGTKTEGHWQQLFYVVFSLCGARADVEVRTPTGRVDMAMILKNHLYIFELKLGGTAQQALRQINRNDYASRFALSPYPLTKIGIAFDKKKHSIKNWIIE